MVYRLFSPDELTKDGLYPLIVFLHGRGERGSDNEAQLKHGVPDILRFCREEREPCFLVAPQCPFPQWWDGIRRCEEGDGAIPVLTVLALVEELVRGHPVDVSRIYLTGLSMGGFGAWKALSLRSDLFAAAVPVCGGGVPGTAESIAAVPQWAFHGAEDDIVPPEKSREMIDALRRFGAMPGYTEYPGIGHASWEPAYRDRAMLRWLFAQRRD